MALKRLICDLTLGAAILALFLPASAWAGDGAAGKSRKPDPPLGGKARDFARQVALYRLYKPYPAKAASAEKALAKLKGYESNAWKGLAKVLNASFHGKPLPGSTKRTLQKPVDGLPVTYYFHTPGRYRPSRPSPLIIALHGGGAGVGDGQEAMSTIGDLFRANGAIAAAPTAPELLDGAWNCPRGYRVVRALIDEISAHYNVDHNRIYVGGHSMGGYGSYFEAIWWPDRFAACLSSAGGISAGSVSDFEGLYNTPLYVIHGTADTRQAPIDFVRAGDKAISMVPLKPREYHYTEIDGAGHSLDTKLRKKTADAMCRHVRDPYPKKVVCLCPTYWDVNPGREMGSEKTGRAFWVEILARRGNTFNEPAKVVAELGPYPNTLTVTTPMIKRVKHRGPADQDIQIVDLMNTVSRVGICLAEDFVDLSKPVKVTCNGTVVFHDFVDRSAEFLLEHLEATGDMGMPFCARIEFDTR